MLPSGYYRLVDKYNDDDLKIGDLVFVTHCEGVKVNFVHGESECEELEEEFIKSFQFAPHGLQERQKRIHELMTDLTMIGSEQDKLMINSEDIPHIEADGGVGGLAVQTSKDPVKMKGALGQIKVNAAKVKNELATRSKELQTLIAEQQAILEAKSSALEKQIAVATEQISVIRTYLGEDEEIVRLQTGEPAAKELKIHLRQLILFMDEECIVAADKGGIDFQDIEKFDKWILNPKHLQQVLPEPKGIVAIKPRRTDKDYSDDPWTNSKKNKHNKMVYILIRNGENLHRIYTTLALHDVFFPRQDEFQEVFYEEVYDRKLKKDVRRPMDTGSLAYMKKMEAAAQGQRRYFKVLILLQGLLDRTKIFLPMPKEGRINLCNMEGYSDNLQFIYDAENLLSDGRPTYDEWQDAANDKIEVGIRIMGSQFPSGRGKYDDQRIFPASCWNTPDSNALYTVENKKDDGYTFLFDRREDRVKKRASYLFHKHDDFILNFDAVTVEEMEYYIKSRTNRHRYMSMIPLLRRAVKLKHEEVKEEAPFRKLLIGEIHKLYKVSFEQAEETIDDLVNWWKYKNKTHRALSKDDAKALRMIVSEYGRRKALFDNAEANKGLDTALLSQFRQEKTLAVFQNKEREYVVYLWHNDEQIFITEETWTYTKNKDLIRDEVREWKTLDNRHLSWRPLWVHDRFATWKKNPNIHIVLTDPQREASLELILRELQNKENREGRDHFCLKPDKGESKKTWGVPLQAVIDDEGRVVLGYVRYHAELPKKLLTERPHEPVVARMAVNFKRTKTGMEYSLGRCHTISTTDDSFDADKLDKQSYYQKCVFGGKGVRRWEDNIRAYKEEFRKFYERREVVDELSRKTWPVETQMKRIMEAKYWEEQRLEYYKEYADSELWEAEKEKRRDPNLQAYWVDSILFPLIERGIDYHGMTVREALAKAKEFKASVREIEDYFLDVVIDAYYKDPDDKPEELEEDEESETLLLEDDSDDD